MALAWHHPTMAEERTGLLLDRNSLEILTRQECMRLLGESHFGRVALSIGALPVILPVNFALFDGDILIRTGVGSKLHAAARNAVIAFEVDRADSVYHGGWSVLVQGMARQIVDPDERARASKAALTPWAGEGDHFVRIATERVSGRRLIA